MDTESLVRLFDFENRNAIFPGVHRSYKFCLMTLAGTARLARATDFLFFAQNIADLQTTEKHFVLSSHELRLLNPNTRTCPIFRTRQDAELTTRIYSASVILKPEEGPDVWGLVFLKKLIDVSIHTSMLLKQDGNCFAHVTDGTSVPPEKAVPLYEAKLIHQYDHRYATFVNTDATDEEAVVLSEDRRCDPYFRVHPRYWITLDGFAQRLGDRAENLTGILSIRGITRATDERTLIACIRPSTPAAHSVSNIFVPKKPKLHVGLAACLNSFVCDYATRQKIGGINLDPYILFQLPVIPPRQYLAPCPWHSDMTTIDWIVERVMELTYTSWDMASFASACGYKNGPFKWNDERRWLLRCEIDAAFLHMYNLTRGDAEYILNTFPIVRRREEAQYGEFRTKRLVLAIHSAMNEANADRTPYRTCLNPPPADRSLCHAGHDKNC